MGRIGATLSGIERTLLNRLHEANAAVVLSSLRMATGKMINRPSDDPSAFVTLSRFQSQLDVVTATTSNVTAANGLITRAQAAIVQIRVELDLIREELVKDEDHALTPQQRAESQGKIDTAIEQINALAEAYSDGRRLLDGSADFLYTGRNAGQVADLTVRATAGGQPTVSGSVTSPATQAGLTYTGSGGQTSAAATFALAGRRGSTVLSVASGEALATVASKINDVSHKTGVTAAVGGDTLTLSSVDYGTQATLGVSVIEGVFTVTGGHGDGTAEGTNASARINGHTIASDSTSVDGNRFTLNENGFRYEIEFAAGFSGSFDPITVSGDALTFRLSTEITRPAVLAIPGLQAARFQGPSGRLDQLVSGGPLSGLGVHTSQAMRVVDEAVARLTLVEGHVEGFYSSAISSASMLLAEVQDELDNSINAINRVDDEKESTRLSHYEALAANSIAGLEILRQQRSELVAVIQRIAGIR